MGSLERDADVENMLAEEMAGRGHQGWARSRQHRALEGALRAWGLASEELAGGGAWGW